jgi:hypothetical protein
LVGTLLKAQKKIPLVPKKKEEKNPQKKGKKKLGPSFTKTEPWKQEVCT